MARVCEDRMTPRSRRRRIAKRALAKRLATQHSKQEAAHLAAKRPRPPRYKQRLERLRRNQAEKARQAELDKLIKSLRPEIEA